MHILVADDDPIYRFLLQRSLAAWNVPVLLATEGDTAWRILQEGPMPLLAILDWQMPGLDGPELCRRVRTLQGRQIHAILLTARTRREDILAGLEAGADDYMTKPFDPEELRARVQVGMRVLRLQQSLNNRVVELEQALVRVQQLQGLLPICSYCKSVRRDQNYWQQVEHYIAAHADVKFSHGICPHCYKTIIEPQLAALRQGT